MHCHQCQQTESGCTRSQPRTCIPLERSIFIRAHTLSQHVASSLKFASVEQLAFRPLHSTARVNGVSVLCCENSHQTRKNRKGHPSIQCPGRVSPPLPNKGSIDDEGFKSIRATPSADDDCRAARCRIRHSSSRTGRVTSSASILQSRAKPLALPALLASPPHSKTPSHPSLVPCFWRLHQRTFLCKHVSAKRKQSGRVGWARLS